MAKRFGPSEMAVDLYLTRLKVGVQEISTVHVPDAPIGVVRRLPVLLCLVD